MAVKRQIKIKKAKQVKPSRAKIRTIDQKYNGSEPLDVSENNYVEALNWYNYEHDIDQARKWLLEYMKRENYSKSDIAAVRRSTKYATPATVGWQARIMMNGNVLSDSSMSYFEDRLTSCIALKEDTVAEEKVANPVATMSIQERTRIKINQLITECEEAVDTDPNLNIYEWLTGREAKPQAAVAIRDYYACALDDLSYGDKFETKAEKKQRLETLKYWESFVADCDRYVNNKKATKVRKPRAKKTKSAVDLVKSLNYQKEFPDLKIVSVNPAEIVGCSQLWAYNTKYRKLTRYDASGPAGIQVKSTTLIGIDADRSMTKRVRKPEDTIQIVLSAGKVSLRKIMDDLKTKGEPVKTRINNDTVLLRVIK